jgi:hypothetical protein
MKSRIDVFHKHFAEKHRISCVTWYYWLCLSEMPEEIAIPEILFYKNDILKQLNRSYVMNSEHDKETHPTLIEIIRNCFARLPEYEYIKDRKPYVSEKDGRLHFDMEV